MSIKLSSCFTITTDIHIYIHIYFQEKRLEMDVIEELSETLWSVDVTSIVKIAIVIWSLRLFGYYMALFYDWILDEIILVIISVVYIVYTV